MHRDFRVPLGTTGNSPAQGAGKAIITELAEEILLSTLRSLC
jgi:hypothetical protein